MDKDKSQIRMIKITAIAYCICAVLWCIVLFVDIVRGNTDTIAVVLHVLCALAWGFGAVVSVLRYRKANNGGKEV